MRLYSLIFAGAVVFAYSPVVESLAAPAVSEDVRTPFLLHARFPGFAPAVLARIRHGAPASQYAEPVSIAAVLARIKLGDVPNVDPGALAQAYYQQAQADPGEGAALASFLLSLGEPAYDVYARWAPSVKILAKPLGKKSAAGYFLNGPAAGMDVGQWLTAGFDGGIRGGGIQTPSASVVRVSAASPSPMPAKDSESTTAVEDEQSGILRLYSLSVDKVQELADEGRQAAAKAVDKEVHKKRRIAKLEESFQVVPGAAIGGAGVFHTKILTPEEVDADPVRRAEREKARRGGEDIVFVRTNTKAQLFGSSVIPIDVSVGPASPSIGLRLSGFIEIVQTRAIPKQRADAWAHAKERVFMWPLSAKHLREVMRVGEDLTITGRVDRGSALALGLGKELGSTRFGSVGVGVQGSVGKAADVWVTLHISKIAPDKVRVVVQKGNGEVLQANVSLTAGLKIYDDSFIPKVNPTGLEDSTLGALVTKGEVKLYQKLADLARAELSSSWSKGKHGSETEGWGSVSLTDPKSAKALDKLFKFNPEAMRKLTAEETGSDLVGAARLNARVRDVTEDKSLQARLTVLRLTRASGTRFYEVQWGLDDGTREHYLVGVVYSRFDGKVTGTKRRVETVMWHDLNRGTSRVTVRLGPQKRLLTTTRETINNVIAVQKALKLPVRGEIDHPGLYLQLFGLGNYGRTNEKGYYTLEPEGVERIGTAGEDELIAAYLKADWLFEKESFPPGYIWGNDEAPPWAEGDASSLGPVLDFFKEHAKTINREYMQSSNDNGSRSTLGRYRRTYSGLSPGRGLRGDVRRFIAARSYARHVLAMQGAADHPERLIELFLRLRQDSVLELKRSIAATSILAGNDSYRAYLEMTGSSVKLVPLTGAPDLPQNPVQRLNGLVDGWKH